MNADIILTLDGQWHLSIENDRMCNFFFLADEQTKKYANIAVNEFDNPHIFYLVSEFSKGDLKHLKEVEKLKNIHIIRFLNSHHGVPFLKPALPVVLNMTHNELCKLETHKHFPLLFEIRYAGFYSTIIFCLRFLKSRFKIR